MTEAIDNKLVHVLTTGGDARIVLDDTTGLNRYLSAPRPRDVLAYASSTANDLSEPAFAHVGDWAARHRLPLSGADYQRHLADLARRIAAAYRLGGGIAAVFAPSGTDLEYVPLAAALGRAPGGILNILLGSDEVGTGCIHSAHGRYFAEETALGVAVKPAEPIAGLGDQVDLADVAVREADGTARCSDAILADIEAAIARAAGAGRHPIVHVVHGSKTGLILPTLGAIDTLRARHGEALDVAVDACQARITGAAIADYLARGATVLLTGSKFMGGPPFSGVALLPADRVQRAAPLPAGYATIFRRAEWPAGWPGAERLDDAGNDGLALRWEATLFELERFEVLDRGDIARTIDAFRTAVRGLAGRIGAEEILPHAPGARGEAHAHPLEMRTLATLDLSAGGATFEEAQSWHRAMALAGVRLGQPVRCVRLPNGDWGATLRIGLSMPLITARADLAPDLLDAAFAADMTRIEAALSRVRG